MKYKLLGKTGIRVSELCLGTMTFGTDWGFGSDKQEAKKIYDAFTNRGGNFFDTANIYTKGTSEKILGEFIKTERENIVVASKYTLTEQSRVNLGGNHRKNMIKSIDCSLKRLNTDYIDLYYVHAWDFTVAPEELMRNLEHLLASGKILSIGISDTPAWIVSKCNTIAEVRGWTPFSAYQVEYNLTERTADREVIPCNNGFDMTFCGFGPLAAGLLSGKYLNPIDEPKRMVPGKSPRLAKKRNLELSRKLVAFSNLIDHTPSQVAICWAMQQCKKASPIFGARTLTQCENNLQALDFVLTKEQMDYLDEISEIPENNPNNFLATQRVQEIIYANNLSRIEF